MTVPGAVWYSHVSTWSFYQHIEHNGGRILHLTNSVAWRWKCQMLSAYVIIAERFVSVDFAVAQKVVR